MAETFFLGLGGVARSGKDTFFKSIKSLLENKNLSVIRVSLADQLKEELKIFCIKEFNIDPTNCNGEDKELIRPLLVEFGKLKRKTSNGRYWIEKLNKKIESFPIVKKTLFVVTDIRFSHYEKDEAFWIKREKEGVIVHLSQYYQLNEIKIYNRPANGEERRNDPLVKKEANYAIELPKMKCSEQELFERLKIHTNQFINILKRDQPSFF